jgi:amino acid adenylation domain-containing protein
MKFQVLDTGIDYWKQQLGGYLPVLQLPSDRLRIATTPHWQGRYPFRLTPTLTDSLNALSSQAGTTLFSTLLAAFKILLYRYSNQDDILVGTQTSDPNQTRINHEDGTPNTLVVRTQLADDLSFRAFLSRVNAAAVEARRQALPFEQLLSELQLGLDLSQQSLFQVMFTLQDSLEESGTVNLEPTVLKDSLEIAPLELQLSIATQEHELVGVLEYNAYLFDERTIARMAGHFQTLLTSIVENPDQSISLLPLLTAAELEQFLVEWKGAAADYSGLFVHRLFEAQAEQNPDAVAVIFADHSLTYRELNRRSNQLARHLNSLGVGPEIRVGVCVTPCLDLVVALLGILKAGGVYVPLDPTYPQERLTFLLEDSQTAVLLTQAAIAPTLPDYRGQVFCLDSQWQTISQLDTANLNHPLISTQAAYLVYTSGTTGKPKGVVAEQRNLTNYILATGDRFQFDRQDVMPCIARFSFSISFFELLNPLVSGGTAMLFARDHVLDINRFVNDLERVTNIHTVPSLMRQIVDLIRAKNLDVSRFSKIKRIFIGGDIVPAELLEQMKATFPTAQIYVFYGCSEATTLLLNYQIPTEAKVEKRLVGKPFNNMSVRLYDKYQNLVPIGIPGEIYVGGAGITRGYLNRPELTQEKYITLDGQQFYRTGDLARYLPDGNLEFLGRFDFQVKIQGVRIELGEIEATLAQHPAVNKTVVTAWEDDFGNKRLVAYVAPEPGQPLTGQELRGFLQGKLSSYMLPSTFVILDTFPLNPNGKIDRRALPAPDQVQIDRTTDFVAPRDELERKLTEIWEQVLGVPSISMTDNFYDLGGTSILVVQLLAQIATVFGKDLPLAIVLEAGTVKQLAAVIRQEAWSAPWTSLTIIQSGGSKTPLFCIHAIKGGILFYRDLALHLGSDQPIYGLQAQGWDGRKQPLNQVEEMAALYIQEIRTVQPEGPYFLTGYSFGAVIAFEMAHQLLRQGQRVAFLALIDECVPGYRKPAPFIKKASRYLLKLAKLGTRYLQQKQADKEQKNQQKLQYEKELAEFQAYQGNVRAESKAGEAALALDDRPLPHDLRVFNVTEANLKALRSYTWKPLTGNAILFVANDEPKGAAWDYDSLLGWGNFVVGDVKTYQIPGDHFSVVREPNVSVLATAFKVCLSEAQVENLSTIVNQQP